MNDKKVKIAINGLGRIGRATLKLALANPEIEVVAINDLADIDNLAYLMKYDSAYGRSNLNISVQENKWQIDGQIIEFLQVSDPANLPWAKLGVDVVIESTGAFTRYDQAKAHLEAGAGRVIISAPAKGEVPAGLKGETVLMGVNEDKLKNCQISSNASCTTNAVSPVVAVLDQAIGIKFAMLNTIHGYTVSQGLVDGPDRKDWRRGRAAAVNLVPSSTGAAKAVALALPQMTDRFGGIAVRVPVITGSLADITFTTKRPTSAEEINQVLKEAQADPRWQGILAVSDEALVSSDIIGRPEAAIVDLPSTQVVGEVMGKVLSWYDNEVGYANTLIRHALLAGRA